MPGKKPFGASEWVDPDNAPELTKEDFARAEIRDGETILRRGRPPPTTPKRLVSLRLDQNVLDGWRRTGAEGYRGRAAGADPTASRRR